MEDCPSKEKFYLEHTIRLSERQTAKNTGLSWRKAVFTTCPPLNHPEDSTFVFLDAARLPNKLTGTFGQRLPPLCIAAQ